MNMSKINTTNAQPVSDFDFLAKTLLADGAKHALEVKATNAFTNAVLGTLNGSNLTASRNPTQAELHIQAVLQKNAKMLKEVMSATISQRHEKLEYKAPEQELTVISTPKAIMPQADITIGGPLAPAKPTAKLNVPTLKL